MGCNTNTYDSSGRSGIFILAPGVLSAGCVRPVRNSTEVPRSELIKTASANPKWRWTGRKLSFSLFRNYRYNHRCVAATAQNINTKMIGTMIGGTSHAVIRSLIAIAGLLELTRHSRQLLPATARGEGLVDPPSSARQDFRAVALISFELG